MILQELVRYYDRQNCNPDSGIAPVGLEWVGISHIIVIDPKGKPISIEDTREKKRSKRYLVPRPVRRSGSQKIPNFLWDNIGYALGLCSAEKIKKKPKDKLEQSTAQQHEVFMALVNSLQHPALDPVKAFLGAENKQALLEPLGEAYESLIQTATNVSFRVAGETQIVPEYESLRDMVPHEDGETIISLVSLKPDVIQRLHPTISGLYGGSTTGDVLVSFNLPAFCSFALQQSDNAPIGQTDALKYATALNHLLRQKLTLGNVSIVCWSSHPEDEPFCKLMASAICYNDDPDKHASAIHDLYNSVRSGKYADCDSSHKVFMLGLEPLSHRIAIRVWIHDAISTVAANVGQHFKDLELCHGPKDVDAIPIKSLLQSAIYGGELKPHHSIWASDIMHAALKGGPYPYYLMQSVMQRIQAEHNPTYRRIALLKAFLNRNARLKTKENKEAITVSLDMENTSAPYLLGRLFATLEKIQSEARDGEAILAANFLASAMRSPAMVFPHLLQLKPHHIRKIDHPGRRIYFESLIDEIIGSLVEFPKVLAMQEQAHFSCGYYHQRQKFFEKKQDK